MGKKARNNPEITTMADFPRIALKNLNISIFGQFFKTFY